jgi:hypothetical protein
MHTRLKLLKSPHHAALCKSTRVEGASRCCEIDHKQDKGVYKQGQKACTVMECSSMAKVLKGRVSLLVLERSRTMSML